MSVVINIPNLGMLTQFEKRVEDGPILQKRPPCWKFFLQLNLFRLRLRSLPRLGFLIKAVKSWCVEAEAGIKSPSGGFMGRFVGVSFWLFVYFFCYVFVESHFHHLPAWLMGRENQAIKLVKKHCIRTFGYGLHQLPVTCRPVLVNGRRFRLPRCLLASG